MLSIRQNTDSKISLLPLTQVLVTESALFLPLLTIPLHTTYDSLITQRVEESQLTLGDRQTERETSGP